MITERDKVLYKKLYSRIKDMILECNLPVSEIANRCGCTMQSLYRFMKNDSISTIGILRLLDFFGYELDLKKKEK